MRESKLVTTTDETVEQSTRSRRRRFRREPKFRSERSRAGRMVMTARDLDMLAAIAKHRFLDTRQVCRLFTCDCPKVEVDGIRGGVAEKILSKRHLDNCACVCGLGRGERAGRGLGKLTHIEGCTGLFKDEKYVAARLTELFHAGLLDRPVAQLQLRIADGVADKGSVPMIYEITGQGLSKIGERRDLLGGARIARIMKGEKAHRLFLEHTLAVADVDIAVSKSVRGSTTKERLSDEDLRAHFSEDRKKRARPFGFEVRLKRGGTKYDLGVLCDLAFGLGNKHIRRAWHYMVEADLGSMPLRRPQRFAGSTSEVDLSKTSIMRKVIAYAQAFEEKQHQTQLGWKNFRVLILTTSLERARNCAVEVNDHFGDGRGGKLFLFGELAAAKGDLLTYEFIACGDTKADVERKVNGKTITKKEWVFKTARLYPSEEAPLTRGDQTDGR